MQRGELVHRIKELHNEYGDIVRTAPNELSFISGNAFHQLYGHRAGHGTVRRMDHFHMTMEMVHNRLARGEEGTQPKNDFLGPMCPHNDDKISIDIPEIEANINDILFAGSETTATALTSITNFVLQNPKELEKLFREIRT
ncbi:hypothetical protein ABVK25_006717 [Lepraria finkii]|uniref:Cytochrome P450 n=1 Tax=Lepraria finkii TaxID=1340010 RepID=A0ABR4B5N2_9LECA